MGALWRNIEAGITATKATVHYGKAQECLAASAVPHLSDYLDLVLFSFCYFTALSWFIYLVLAPQLCRLSPPKQRTAPSGVDQLNHGGSLRAKWAHMIASFVHALMVGLGGTYFWLRDTGYLGLSQQSRLFGFSPQIANMIAFSVGYFLWDVLVCLWHSDIYGRSYLIHAVMALVGMGAAFSRNPLMYYTNRYLMFEISTIFVDFHWFFAKMGYDKTKRQLAADIGGLLSYIVVRMGFGYASAYSLTKDFYEWHLSGDANYTVITAATALQVITHGLNMYWFLKLARSALGKPSRKQKTN